LAGPLGDGAGRGWLDHPARSSLLATLLAVALVAGVGPVSSAAADPADDAGSAPAPASDPADELAAPSVDATDGAGPDADEEVEEEDPGPTPEELAHEAALQRFTAALRAWQQANAAIAGARGGSASADGSLRQGENALVPLIVDRLEREQEVDQAATRLDAAVRQVHHTERRLDRLRDRAAELDSELEVARADLETRVIRAYKTGSLAYETTSIPLALVREATSPGELAVAVKHLAALMGAGAEHLEQLTAEAVAIAGDIEDAEHALADALAERADAEVALDVAEEAVVSAALAIDSQEGRAAALRASANAAESRLLAAFSAVAERRADLRERHEDAVETAAAADTDPPALTLPDADADADDEAAAGVRSRERALARQRSLPPEDRRTDDGWVCPVEGARFVNDWGFPRSHQRRHEGTDVFAPMGTPIVAPADAVVAAMETVDRFDGRLNLGGVTVTLEQGRHRYYLAHLDTIQPELTIGDEVRAGDVVGTVGRTGNARGTPPHLHLGWYVDRVAVNPYASLAVACSPDRPDPAPADDGSGPPS
jgi:murein DD-endopeptidase MepM/ murein hydrolase activator NlpD